MEAPRIAADALHKVLAKLNLPTPSKLVIEPPKDPAFGDLATNAALLLAKDAGKNPRELAQLIASQLLTENPLITSATVAGPGFINLVFAPELWQGVIQTIEKAGDKFGRSHYGDGQKVLVEYVSANPTGPLHVGHGRGAALGDTVARILDAAGYTVATEYYLNDAGRQMRTLGLSIWLRIQQLLQKPIDFPQDCYQGGYIIELARELLAKEPQLPSMPEADAIARCQQFGTEEILAGIQKDLEEFSCTHNSYASEASLLHQGAVENTLADLKNKGYSYEKDGALWLDTSAHGDDRDRVLRKSDGYLTYFATDIAYHHQKFQRGFDWLIDVWGADHHGYIPRMKAAIEETGHDPDKFSVLLVQLVNLQRGGQAVSMSTRSGEFVTLRDVVREAGRDAARFMFLSRSSDSPLDFDLDLVKQRTLENPVYYVQYAHARVAALLRRATEQGIVLKPVNDPSLVATLTSPEELSLLHEMSILPEVITSAARNLAPHQLTRYLLDLAGLLHAYYAKKKVLNPDDPAGSAARLALVRAAGQCLRNGLNLLGVSAPDTM